MRMSWLFLYSQITSPWWSSCHLLFSFCICTYQYSGKDSRGPSADLWSSLLSSSLFSSTLPHKFQLLWPLQLQLLPLHLRKPKGSIWGSLSLCNIQLGSCLWAVMWCNSACFPPSGITVLGYFLSSISKPQFNVFFFSFPSCLRQIK